MTKKIIKPAKKKLPKILREPIALESLPSPPTEGAMAIWPELKNKYKKEVNEIINRNADSRMDEYLNKLELLYKHYNLDIAKSDDRFLLTMYLAIDYIPGFRTSIKAKSGRTKGWGQDELFKLYLTIEKKISEHKSASKRFTLKTICHKLSQEEPWKTFLKNSKDGGGVLHDNYLKAQKTTMAALLIEMQTTYPEGKNFFYDRLLNDQKKFP